MFRRTTRRIHDAIETSKNISPLLFDSTVDSSLTLEEVYSNEDNLIKSTLKNGISIFEYYRLNLNSDSEPVVQEMLFEEANAVGISRFGSVPKEEVHFSKTNQLHIDVYHNGGVLVINES